MTDNPVVRFIAAFHLGQGVKFRPDPVYEVQGSVIAVRFYDELVPEYLIGWWAHGEMKSDWFAGWRLSSVAP